jgi:DNA-binding response OmpR family regulator
MTRILFADSEPHIRRLWLEELQDEGYEVMVTGNGRGVVLLLDSFQPDLVILEALLPDMSGLETGRIVKGTRRSTPVVLYSHCRPPKDLEAWGVDDFVIKSHDLDDLKKVVRRLLPVKSVV